MRDASHLKRWRDLAVDFAKRKNISYKDALKSAELKAEYKGEVPKPKKARAKKA